MPFIINISTEYILFEIVLPSTPTSHVSITGSDINRMKEYLLKIRHKKYRFDRHFDHFRLK